MGRKRPIDARDAGEIERGITAFARSSKGGLGGALISYGPDPIDPHRRAAVYVDRILRDEKPADLPVQAPTKYELVIKSNIPPSTAMTGAVPL